MKQEIKERMEKIRRGEVPEGYQETKVGIIPDDWEVKRLEDKTTKIGSGITPNGGEKVYKNEGRPFLRSQNVGWGDLILEDVAFIDDEIHNTFKATEIAKNDVFLNITGASIGRSAIADERVQNGNVNQHVCIIRTIGDELISKFLNCFLLSQKGQKQIDSFQAGGNRQGLNFEQIKSFQIPLPPLPRQQKIVEILSTWDKAIELKENIIEERNKFKRGLMQNIIFAQMNDKSSWEFAKFKDIFEIIKRPIDKNPEEDYKRLTVKRRLGGVQLRDIKKGKEILVDSQHIVKEDDVIISNKQVFHGAIGVVPINLENSIVSIEYNILRCKEGFDTKFLFYCMYSSQFKKTIIKRTQGVHEEKFVFLFNEWYNTLGIYVPSIDDQKSIVSILNNLNENIQILSNEVALLKEQKRGLMQLLLTGIVRVEVN